MKKTNKYTLWALGAFMLTACGNDDSVIVNEDGNAVNGKLFNDQTMVRDTMIVLGNRVSTHNYRHKMQLSNRDGKIFDHFDGITDNGNFTQRGDTLVVVINKKTGKIEYVEQNMTLNKLRQGFVRTK